MPNYSDLNLKDDRGGDVRLWRCDECGSTVGPESTAKGSHDEWHKRIEWLEKNVP